MSVKSFCLGGLAAAVLGLGVARGQTPTYGGSIPVAPGDPGSMSGVAPGVTAKPGEIISDGPRPQGNFPFYGGPRSLETPGTGAPAPQAAHGTLSSWIINPRSPGCCGPAGKDGPIVSELFFRVGPSFNLSGGIMGHALDVGWDIEGGARALFFNAEVDAAWTAAFSISNNYNHADDQTERIRLTDVKAQQAGLPLSNPIIAAITSNGRNPLPSFLVTVRSLNRTYANLGVGREWFVWGPAHVNGISEGNLPNVRFGIDAGGRYGSASIEVNEIRHRTDVIGGLFIALHGEVEIPCHCCILTAGLRTEYGYTWTDILQHQNRTDVQDLNLLFTFGTRF